jgi:hypothetical protein
MAPELKSVFEACKDLGAPQAERIGKIVQANGSAELDARYTWQTDTGALISVPAVSCYPDRGSGVRL